MHIPPIMSNQVTATLACRHGLDGLSFPLSVHGLQTVCLLLCSGWTLWVVFAEEGTSGRGKAGAVALPDPVTLASQHDEQEDLI